MHMRANNPFMSNSTIGTSSDYSYILIFENRSEPKLWKDWKITIIKKLNIFAGCSSFFQLVEKNMQDEYNICSFYIAKNCCSFFFSRLQLYFLLAIGLKDFNEINMLMKNITIIKIYWFGNRSQICSSSGLKDLTIL